MTMSNHLVKAYKDGNGSSGMSLRSPQSTWMSHWTSTPSNQGSLLAPQSQTSSRDEVFDHTQKSLGTNLGIPRSYGTLRNTTKSEKAGLDMRSLTLRPQLCLLGSRDRENIQTATSLDPSCVQVTDKSSVLESNPSPATRILATNERDGNFTNHFYNTGFINLNQGSRRREKYSSILVHERSAFSPLHSDNQFEGMQIDCQDDATVRNVECEGNSHGRPPMYSRTTTHHVLFSTHESTQHRGVKIQPLWSTTDSEKDNYGDAETPRFERSFDLSADTDTMDAIPFPNDNNSSGTHFSPIAKNTMATDNIFPMDGVDPWKDKAKGKLPVTETPSSSRTQSMETEHLLSCAEQFSEHRDKCTLQEPDCNRSLKRLKLSSSPSHEKTHALLNMMVEHSKESSKDENHSKEVSQNMVPVTVMANREPSSLRTKKNPIFESSWIQRWCQEKDPRESVTVCEHDRPNSGLDEVDKKRFPSIAAVAMMGKSVDGLHTCTYTKRGPLVVWNNKDD